MNIDVAAGGRRGLWDWAALAGAAFVVLFVVGNLLLFADTVSGDSSPAEFREYYSDSGNRDRISFGWVVASIGLFFFLWFLGALRELVRGLDGDRMLGTLTTIGGSVYAAMALTAIALDSAVRTMSDDTFGNEVYPELIHAADDAGYVIHATGGVGLAAMILAVSLVLLRTRALPRWLGWFGIVAAIAALLTITFVGALVWLLWVLVVSVFLFLRGGRNRTARAAEVTTA